MSLIEKVKSGAVGSIRLKTLLISALLGCALTAATLLTYKTNPESAILILVVALVLIIAFQIESYYRIQYSLYHQNQQIQNAIVFDTQHRKNDYLQIEAMFSVFSMLKLNHPLPVMRGWAISPDFAVVLLALVNQHKPRLIVEASSGVSTLIIGYQIKNLGTGKVISLEHEESYAKISMQQIANHELLDVATVIHAPLKKILVNSQTWQWYDTSELFAKLQQKVDLLVIDGPPGDLQSLSRYPALPVLFEALSDRAIVVIDDASREDEQKIIALWKQEFNCSLVSMIANEKGAAILQIQK